MIIKVARFWTHISLLSDQRFITNICETADALQQSHGRLVHTNKITHSIRTHQYHIQAKISRRASNPTVGVIAPVATFTGDQDRDQRNNIPVLSSVVGARTMTSLHINHHQPKQKETALPKNRPVNKERALMCNPRGSQDESPRSRIKGTQLEETRLLTVYNNVTSL